MLILTSNAQTPNFKSIDNYTNLISEKYKSNALKEKQLEGKRTPGGTVTGYYMKNKLVLITTHSADEFAYNDYFYYIEADSLLFVRAKHIVMKEPVNEKEYAEYEKYLLFNTDHKGNTDVNKWPLITDLSNEYYIDNNQIIRYDLKNSGKALKAADGEIEGISKDLITRFTSHMQELK
ncbi:hypothetical protein CNR22_21270 [Sphingobacteriaceae bacterium]|nr:hypothetical protein CNR22_21270 [Sphingobacteriaceae bacterium]